jgi:hypothetical protein
MWKYEGPLIVQCFLRGSADSKILKTTGLNHADAAAAPVDDDKYDMCHTFVRPKLINFKIP